MSTVITEEDDFDFEDEFDCESCELDYDEEFDEEEFDEDEARPKKKQKAKELSVEDYLSVLRANFDDVLWEERQDEWFDHITYQRLECRTYPSPQENLNQNIEYVVWISRDILNGGHYPRHKDQLKYICDNLKMLRSGNQSDFTAFFEPIKMIKTDGLGWTQSKTGLPDNGLYKRHIGMKKPTTDDFVNQMKSVLQHVFKDSPIDQKNERFGRFDDYWFDGDIAWNWVPFDQYKTEGIEPIALFQLFSSPMRIYLGPRLTGWSEYQDSEYVYYWVWSDVSRSWNDRNGMRHDLDLINDTDIIDWLYDFTGLPRKEHDIEGEKMEYLIDHLRNRERHEGIEDWPSHVESLAKKAKSPKELKSFLTDGIKYDPNGGFGSPAYLGLLNHGGNYCLDSKIDYKIQIDVRYAKYLNIDFSTYSMDKWRDNLNVFDAQEHDIWETVYDHFNPKAKVLSLFDDFAFEEHTTVEAEKDEPVVIDDDEDDPFALFEDGDNEHLAIEEHVDDEEEEYCGCDYDSLDEDECDYEGGCSLEDKSKKGAKKSVEKTVDYYLSILKSLFDEVTYEKGAFYKQLPKVIDGIASQLNETYYHLTCSMIASSENKNPNIVYETWVDLKIRSHHNFQTVILEKVVDGYELLVKNGDIRFFDVEDATIISDKRIGLNYYLLYKDRRNDPIPALDVLREKQKEVIGHVFKNGVFEENNPRFGNQKEYSIIHYSLEKPSRLKQTIDERGGIDDISLLGYFATEVQIGTPRWVTAKTREEGGFYSYPYSMRGVNYIQDSGNNTTYSYEAPIDREYVQWLREFTGIPEKRFESLEDAFAETVENALHVHHLKCFEIASLEAICKGVKNPQALREKLFTQSHSDRAENFSGSSSYCFLDYRYEVKKGQISVTVSITERSALYFGYDVSKWKREEGYRGGISYTKTVEMYEFVYLRYNEKPKALSLFDDLIIESKPANNTKDDLPVVGQLSFF